MSCTIDPKVLRNTLQQALYSNPEKYRNLENSVRDIIKVTNLTDEAKVKIIAAYSELYKALSKKSSAFNLNKLDFFLEANVLPLVNDVDLTAAKYTDALARLQAHLGIAPTSDTSQNLRVKELAAQFSEALDGPIIGRYQKLKELVDTVLRERSILDAGLNDTQDLNSVKLIQNALDKLVATETDKYRLRNLGKLLKTGLAQVRTPDTENSFVPLSLLPELGKDRFEAYMPDGSILNLTKQDGQYIILDENFQPTGEVYDLENNPAPKSVFVYNTNWVSNDGATTMVNGFELRTGFAVVGDVDGFTNDVLASNDNPVNSITIIADTSGAENNARRMERIQQAAGQYPALANRTVETKETPSQVKALQAGKPVLTRGRLTEGFSIRMVSPSGNTVTLMGFDNYVVVYPDNSTRVLDFENDEDLALFADMTSVRKKNGFDTEEIRPTTMEDLQVLRDGARRFKQFQAEVQALLDKGETVIPGSLFSRYFEMTNEVFAVDFSDSIDVADRKRGERLDQFMNKHDAGISVQVINESDPTNVMERTLPLMFRPLTRNPNSKWVPMEMLGQGEYVLVDGVKYKWVEYVETFITPSASKSIKNLSNLHLHPYAMLIPTKNGRYAVQPLLRSKMAEESSSRAMAFLAMHAFAKNFTKTTSTTLYTRAFNNEVIGFDINGMVKPDMFTNQSTKGAPFLAIQFNPTTFNADAALFEEHGDQLTALADLKLINSATDLITKFFDAEGLSYDLSSQEGVMNMFQQLDGIFKNGSDKESVQVLQKQIDDLYQKFTDKLYKSVSKKVDALLNHTDPTVRAAGQQMIGSKEKFLFKLFEMQKGKPVLKLNARHYKQNDLSSYHTLNATYRNRLHFQYNLPSAFEASTADTRPFDKQVDSIKTPESTTPVQDAISPNTTKPAGGRRLDDSFDTFDDPFGDGAASFGTPLERSEFEEGEYQRQVDYIRERLPKGISIDDLNKIIRRLDADGNVLGYIKDRVIFLSENLSRPGTAYHEAFHAVFRYLLTPQERADILAREYEKMGVVSESDIAEFRKQRKGLAHMSNTEVIAYMAEERLADKFQSYATKKTKAQTWYQKLFSLIEKLIEFFTKHGNEIDQLFDKIHSGFYKNAEIKDFSGVDGAYKLIRTVPTMGVLNTKPHLFYESMNASDMMQLRNIMVYEMLRTKNANLSPSERYDEIAKSMIDYYNINNFIAQSPYAEKAIRDKYENTFRDFRFVLGALNKGEVFGVQNLTGDPAYDGIFIDNSQEDSHTASAKESYKQMKNMVLEVVENLNIVDTVEQTVATDEINGEDNAKSVADAKANVEEMGSKDPDVALLETGTSEGDREFRKIFQFLVYEEEDPRLGIKIRKPVNADRLFDTVKKLTVNVPKENLLPHINSIIQRMESDMQDMRRLSSEIGFYPLEYDNVYELANSLKAMMQMLNSTCAIVNGVSTRNDAMFNQFHSVFYVSTGEITRVDLKTNRKYEDTSVTINTELSTTDMVQSQDNLSVLNKVIDGYDNIYRLYSPETKKEISQQWSEVLNEVYERGSRNVAEFYLQNGEFSEEKVNKLADKIYVLASKIGMGLPRHFFHFSLLSMAISNGAVMPEESESKKIMRANSEIFKEKGYMGISMMFAIKNMLDYNESVPLFSNSNSPVRKKVYGSFLPAMLYITRYDTTVGQPVVQNVTGNKIYRFTLYSPNMQVVQDVQHKGLDAFVSEVYGPEFTEWFQDNPYLSDPELGPLLIDYLKIGYLGGLSQNIDERGKINTDAADLDKVGYHLSNIALFGDRHVYSRQIIEMVEQTKNGQTEFVPQRRVVKLGTFKRITSQNDATGTVYHVTGRYEQYATDLGLIKQKGKGKELVSLISKRLSQVIEQEYNRIGKQWRERHDSKKRYNGYNGMNQDGVLNTDNPKLRAYNFQALDGFFLNEISAGDTSIIDSNVAARTAMRDTLIAAAKDGKSFEEALQDPAMVDFFSQLDNYAGDEFSFFLETLEKENIISKDKNNNYQTDFFDTKYYLSGQEVKNNITNLEAFLKDYFMNDWVNRLLVNQLFDGDKSVGIDSAVNYYKRLKSQAAAGKNAEAASTLVRKGQTSYRHAVITIPGKKQMKVYFDQADLTKPQSHSPEGMIDPVEFDIMDGQVYQTLDHRMRFLSAEGKLDARSEEIIRSLRYKRLSFEDNYYLQQRGIQLNSQKTVTAHPIHYLKMSEHYLNRLTVSYYKDSNTKAARARVAELYKAADMYAGYLEMGVEVDAEGNSYEDLYRNTISQIHEEFAPVRGKEMLHNMLNNMEYHRLGQIMDNSSSKRGTLVPAIISLDELENGTSYWDLENHTASVPMRYAYNQVATEAHGQEVTDSIQPKLLIDTDLNLDDPNVPESVKTLVKEYRSLLQKMAYNSRQKFERMVTKDGQVDIASFYKMIQESLMKQGAPQHMLKKYDVIDGVPVHSPNLNGITEALKYYVFSAANSTMFQPKAPGFKFFHASSFGYQIVVDKKTGKVVSDEELRTNPAKFNDKKKYDTRYPAFNKTTNKEGIDEYYVEVLIPRPISTNSKKLRVIEKSFEEFFGTRIPTEDKRSMVRVKVIGYIDSSYINTVIVPEQIHNLSGSDKDIDALYTRIQGMYDNVLGEANIYGDYSEYETRYGLDRSTAKFVEYLHYMMDDPFFGPWVSKELRRMKDDPNYQVENLRESAAMFGPKVQEFFNRSMDDIQDAMKSRYRDLKERKPIQTTGKTFKSLSDLSEVLNTEQDEKNIELQRQLRLLEKMAAVVNVLQDSGMPVTAQELEKYEKNYGSPVIPIMQNQLTTLMNQILGHDYVYTNLYSKETSNAKIYKDATEALGRDEKAALSQSNLATITSVANVRDSNKSAKRGIEIFAAFNKGLSLAVKHGLELRSSVWNINEEEFTTFQDTRKESTRQRAHSLVGNSLGMATDAAKYPYPAVLSLNQYNMGVTAMMLSLGIDPYFSIYINLVPVIKNTIDTYDAESQGSVRRNLKNNVSLTTTLENKLEQMINSMMKSGSEAEKEFASTFDHTTFSFRFDLANVDANTANSNNPTIESLGIEVVDSENRALTQSMKDLVMFAKYLEQHKQAEAVRYELAPLTDAQQSLNPEFNTIDRLIKTYTLDPEKSAFLGYEKIRQQSPVYKDLKDSVMFMDEFVGKIFLDRNVFIKELNRQLNGSIYEATPDSIGGHIKGYLALQALKHTIKKALENPDLATKSPVAFARYTAFMKMLKADYWYNNDMVQVLQTLKAKFPGNAFLDAVTMYNAPNGAKILRSVSKAKVTEERKELIMTGMDQLLTSADASVRDAAYQIFYYSIIKDGMNKAPYSLQSFLNPDNFREISRDLKKVEEAFKTLEQFGKEKAKSTSDYIQKFEEVFKPILGESVSAQNIISEIMEKVISIYNATPTGDKVQVLNYTNERGKFAQEKEQVVEAIKSIRPGMGETILEETKTYKDKKGRSRKFKNTRDLSKQTTEQSNADLLLPDADNRVILDFTIDNVNKDALYDKIAKHYKIFALKRDRTTGQKNYLFPVYLTNSYGDLLVLRSIDEEAMGTKLLNNVARQTNSIIAEVDGDSGKRNPFVGQRAEYEVVVRQGDANINPIAFDREEAEKIYQYSTGEAKATINTLIKDGKYKGVRVLEASAIQRSGETGEPGAAQLRRETNTIYFNRERLLEKFINKAWTNPLQQRDKTFATSFPEDIFKTYEEWENFVLEHERQHLLLGVKRSNETYGQYEDRVNIAALKELYPGIDVSFLEAGQGSTESTTSGPVEVKIFKWNRPSAARGTDAAMREVADGFIGEIEKKGTSSNTSLTTIDQKLKDRTSTQGTNRPDTFVVERGIVKAASGTFSSVIMLARNGTLKNQPLQEDTKLAIRVAKEKGLTFVVGDMDGVDTPFIDYLNAIGATYSIYGHGRLKGVSDKVITPGKANVQNEVKESPMVVTTPATPLEIFVDGSDIKGTGKLGYGAAVEYNGKMYKMSGTEESKAFNSIKNLFPDAKFSNPTMEMLGLVMTLNSFKDKAEHIVIRQDYKGAVNYGALWNRSEGSMQREPKPWKAKEPYIQYLVEKAVEMIEKIESNGGSVKLEWVKGHSGHKMNDAADEAAKNRGIFNEFGQLFQSTSVDKVIQSKTDESKNCNN